VPGPAPTSTPKVGQPAQPDPWAVSEALEREQLPSSLPPLRRDDLALPAQPRGLPAPPKRCSDFTPTVPAACGDPAGALAALDTALALTDAKARNHALMQLEGCEPFAAGLMTALRADLAPVECADVIVRDKSNDAAVGGEVHDALIGLGLAGMLSRASTAAPEMKAPFTKDTVVAFIKKDMKTWAEEHAVALQALAATGSRLRYYGKAVVAVEAGLADMRYVEAMRAVPLPDEFNADKELAEAYLTSLEQSLDPRKQRGRDAALVGLGGLATIGVIRDERVRRARELLSKMFGGSRIDALDTLILPPLAPVDPANAEQRLAARLQTFYASMIFAPDVAADEAMLRQLIENGVSLPHRIALGRVKLSPAARLYYARARFELGQNYWRSVDFDEATRLLVEWPDDAKRSDEARLLLGLGIAMQGGPKNAADMMERAPLQQLGIGAVAALDALSAEGGALRGLAAFDAALLAQLAAPAEADADYWRKVSERYRSAAAVLADVPHKRDAETRATEADAVAKAIAER
jgi:hypothetical protein